MPFWWPYMCCDFFGMTSFHVLSCLSVDLGVGLLCAVVVEMVSLTYQILSQQSKTYYQ